MPQQERNGLKRGVTLNSYQEEYYTRIMTLEDCLAEVASMGAEGVEMLAEQMIPDYPNPPQSWVDQWFKLLEKYHLKPVCLDTFVDSTWGGHRAMNVDESLDILSLQMELCNRLGFNLLRPTTAHEVAPEMMLKALSRAEKHDVKIALEINSPATLGSTYIGDYLEMIAKTGTEHFGFTLDMGIFCERLPRILCKYYLHHGVSEEVVQYVSKAFADGADVQAITTDVKKISAKETDQAFSMVAYRFGPTANHPSDLPLIIPYTYNIHGKLYEMTEEMQEYSIPYQTILPILMENSCTAYINSEYEGQRFTQDMIETDSCEQIRRHHLMLRQLLGEI